MIWSGGGNSATGGRFSFSLVGVRSQHGGKKSVGREIMQWPRDTPFEHEADRREDIAKKLERLRIIVGVLVGVLLIEV